MSLTSGDLYDLVDAILDGIVPKGKLKNIPFSVKNGITFSYNNDDITISPLYTCKSSQCYYFDMTWDRGTQGIYGIPVKSGVNIMEQYTGAPLPNLYAFNMRQIGKEVMDYRYMLWYFIDPLVTYDASESE